MHKICIRLYFDVADPFDVDKMAKTKKSKNNFPSIHFNSVK